MKNKTITAYKGFDKNLVCHNDSQYKIGKTFSVEPPVHRCIHGLHACLQPIDVLSYYPPDTGRYARVTLSGDTDMGTYDPTLYREVPDVDTKIAAEKLHVDKELSLSDLVDAQFKQEQQNPPTLISPARCYQTNRNYERFAYVLSNDNESAIISVDYGAPVLPSYVDRVASICIAMGMSAFVSNTAETGIAITNRSWSMAHATGYRGIAIARGSGSVAVVAGYSSHSIAIAASCRSRAICNTNFSTAYADNSKLELHARGCLGVLHGGIAVVDVPDCVVFISEESLPAVVIKACKGTVLIIQSLPGNYGRGTSNVIYYHTVVVGKDIKPNKDGVITGKQLLAYTNFRRHKSLNRD